ncbi:MULTISPECIES: YtxH domain-containing protein [Bacteroidota]|jgi:gas vesicle protein|uniref:YtxH domain-containing protein n=3 Tax=Flectobacillus TaxID=101 RepID=A0ABT6YWN1_9BACT|nr:MULTISPECIES: YtxH domain-containing protein [Bacteroidota]NBA74253.1 YtxH domain-containing protein [Emticicia sp. ODNR4P]MDI9862135.1 YtxH domain-containing protein [Flectobacillus roseus]MDI9864554.1 YtxH domain-containing protein [Flectobacillus longus]MDI9873290.1 YtxH domain-containing protein [Flectobacillus rivi]MDI9880135.1 YtxH domain-containing protein [Flectobacillus longus]
MTKNTKIALSLFAAAAAGAVVGMLLAPEKGKDLRKKIKDGTGNLTDDLLSTLKTGKAKLQEVTNKA